ncbi:uncharacterized protein PADG_12332 [Paracoccidioides brasiliensis Pb18]|uniref:Uncharacterized protein n=2 Tax=Paracoccidioides brasiliensis TaxID=121759 RepID=A0A0A0HSC7_PARBD|nr:uncharacterized protein PADG_12332 [Paracoccidioides brasiliensis Pb18]KGM91557.1 hypothetical protein PADG_12332 [Paracoccidioides brasiliensis Pb18]ODH38465.1 hypothetical protein ACO22_02316 [Paracoccidioides brasiliensis]
MDRYLRNRWQSPSRPVANRPGDLPSSSRKARDFRSVKIRVRELREGVISSRMHLLRSMDIISKKVLAVQQLVSNGFLHMNIGGGQIGEHFLAGKGESKQ